MSFRNTSAALLIGLTLTLAGCHPASRPPTPKPTVDTHGLALVDVAKSAGIDFAEPAQPRPFGTREAFGMGCAFVDYDNDGWPDVLVVGRPHPMLYHNLGNGHFDDVTEKMGLAKLSGFWAGCAAGDVDGDGYLDIALTGYKCFALLKNTGGQGFVDVTRQSGLDPTNRGLYGSGVGFMDLAGHGRLDLVILNYIVLKYPSDDTCPYGVVITGCPPGHYQPEYPELWENLGGGKFQDDTVSSGIRTSNGKGLVLSFIDIDNSGRQSISIGNDGMTNDLMLNKGVMKFKNVGQQVGLSTDEAGGGIATMSSDWADYDRDGNLDLFETNFSQVPFQLYHNLGYQLFEHTEKRMGVAVPPYIPLGFGSKWADIDNDGWPDILALCGHVYTDPGKMDGQSSFREPTMLFYNDQGKKFVNLTPALGGDLARPILGRGLASGDFDNDGKIDFLGVDLEGPVMLLHNQSTTTGHWVTLDLRSATSNRFAYGAEIKATTGKTVWVQEVSPATAYLSSSDPRVHFGMGGVDKLETVDIRWPDGTRQHIANLAADHIYRIVEGRQPSIFTPAASHT